MIGDFLSEPLILPVKKLWTEVSDTVSLTINLVSPDVFSFSSSIVSDYVDESELSHFYFKNNKARDNRLSEEDLVALEVRNFSQRIFIYPASGTYAAFSLLIYPEDVDDLKAHALYSNPKWPGLLLCEGQFLFFPASASKKLKWGSPFLPLFRIYMLNLFIFEAPGDLRCFDLYLTYKALMGGASCNFMYCLFILI